MTFDEYQLATKETVIYQDTPHHPVGTGKIFFVTALGLAGEAGEVADMIKKHLYATDSQEIEVTKKELTKEFGDVLWYIARLADDLGVSLEEVVQMNLEKCRSRKERGVLHGRGNNR